MSETETTEQTTETAKGGLELNTLFAFKMGMTTYYDENGDAIGATLLKYEPLVVSQLKTEENDGYTAVQVAFKPKREKRTAMSEKSHLKGTGFENGSYHVREIRQAAEGAGGQGRSLPRLS